MIYCEFIVKIMCTYHNEKKKKKRENSNCGNGIAEIGGENLHLFRQSHCHNYQKYFFFFFSISAMVLPQLLFFSTRDIRRAGIWAEEFR